MVEKLFAVSEELIELAAKFIEEQRGTWDNEAWLNFLAEVQKKGFDITDNIKTTLGLMLESMKKFYNASVATKGVDNAMLDISSRSTEFIKNTKGIWDQSEWEKFLRDLQKTGFDLTEEASIYIGNVIDVIKDLYDFPPTLGKGKSK